MDQDLRSKPPVLAGYTYVRPLGSGGFADVFLYEQDMPRRAVAVKVLRAEVIDDDVLRRFKAEADVMARLSTHPSVLTIFHASVSSDGRPFLATEYCVDSMAARYRREPLELSVVLDTGVRMASALETAHGAGVLHRDIKPSNILITTLGTPVLSDFGIAMSLGGAQAEELVAMSVPWSSPEILREATTGTIASEVWSLGATLYTLLAGRSPFALPDRAQNDSAQIRSRIVHGSYIPIGRADVPTSVEALLARSMSPNPAHRPQNMLDFAHELRGLQQDLAVRSTGIDVAAQEWAAPKPVPFGAPEVLEPASAAANARTDRPRRVAAERPALLHESAPIAAASPFLASLIGAVLGAAAVSVMGAIALLLTGSIG